VCRAPASIAGLAEVYGIGPRTLAFEPAAVIDLVVRLVERAGMPRLQDEAAETIAGCRLPRIDVARQNVTAALPALMARLSIQPFS
jgi:serine kinase of HPr protein (carbohydrate metabolism regulator)